ncbi:MAG: AMP-binding protein, partial [Bacteroidales bacterium]|nr:AMP-binding protein [Bacteroidales bacterium]
MADIQRIFDLLEKYKHGNFKSETALAGKYNGTWKHYSAEDYVNHVNELSRGLLSLGVKPGENILTIVNNCPEWNFFDMAIMQIGAVQVPVYPTISESNYEYILKETSVRYIIVSNREIFDRIKNLLPSIPSVKTVYAIEETEGLPHWTEIL